MPANVIIRIGAEASQAISEIGRVNKSLGESLTGSQKAQKALTKAALPAAAALGAISVAAVAATKAAIEDQAAQAKLTAQLGRVTDATAAQLAGVDDWISAQSRATAVADDELRPALGKLASATGDLGAAQKELGIALDISAQTGKSLDSVSTALAKGYTGQTAGLNKLVPGLDQVTLKSKDMIAINAELAAKTGGAATEAANTAAGAYKNWQIQLGELQETMGQALIPVVEQLMPLLLQLTDFVSHNAKAATILIGVVAALAAGILVANAALKAYAAAQLAVRAATAAWTAAQWLLNAALTANPIGLVIVAVAALAAGIVIAYRHSETFRSIVQAAMAAVVTAFNSVLAAASAVFNWIKAHWTVAALALGPVGVAIALLATHFDQVKAAGVGAFNAILGAIQAVASAIQSAIGWAERLISALGRIHVPHLPHIPGLPFSAYGYPVPAMAGGLGAGARAPGGTAAAPLTINVYGAVDPEGTARAIRRILSAHDRRQGRR